MKANSDIHFYITEISLLISLIICSLLIWWGMDVGYIGKDGTHTQQASIIWWSCSVIVGMILAKMGSKFDVGWLMVVLIGPITLLTLFINWIWREVIS